MSNPFGGFTALVQGTLGVTLAYYMLDLAVNSADPGFPKMVAYNAGAWAMLKGLRLSGRKSRRLSTSSSGRRSQTRE